MFLNSECYMFVLKINMCTKYNKGGGNQSNIRVKQIISDNNMGITFM